MKVLLLSSNAQDLEYFKKICALINFDLVVCKNAVHCCDELIKDHSALVIVDASNPTIYQSFYDSLSQKIGFYSTTINVNHFFYVSDSDFHEIPYLASSEVFGHFIQRKYNDDNIITISKLLQLAQAERAFGVKQYFADNTQHFNMTLTQTTQKKTAIEFLKGHLATFGFKARMATIIADSADELLMNAIFDAPVDALGKHIYAQTPRNAEFDLDAKNTVELAIYFAEPLVAISVVDQHGSLNKKKMLSQHIAKSYEANQYQAKALNAGAGLGLAHVYRNCGGLVFISEANAATEVILFCKRTDSFKDFKEQFRFLATFMYF